MNDETTIITPAGRRALALTHAAVETDAPGDTVPRLPSRHAPRMQRLLAGVKAPARLGDFRLGRLLGVGGMGAVFESVHERTGARAAVKVAPRTRPRQTEALRSEVAALARVNAPGLVRVLDTGETDELTWMAIELIEGPSLADVVGSRYSRCSESTFVSFATGELDELRKHEPADSGDAAPRRPRRLSWVEIVRAMEWFRDVARTLAALHDAGLVHRDLKPQNILLAPGGVPHLIDLGIARDVSDLAGARGRLEGTVPFMSPEQTQSGFTATGPRSDVYSLAVTFHEVLTGRRTVRGADAEALASVAFTPIPPPSRLSPELPADIDPIFERALRKDPAERHASAHDLVRDIDGWLQRARRSRPAARWARRHRAALGAVTAVVVVVLGTWLAGEIADRRDVAEIRAELDAGRAGAAYDLTALRSSRLRDVAGFRDVAELAVARAAPVRTQRMLASQAFTVDVLAPDDAHASHARTAARLIGELGLRHEHLVFQVALSQHLAGRPDEAADTLDRMADVTEGSALLSELDALVAVAAGKPMRARRALDRIPALMATSAPDAATLTCVRAYRLLAAPVEADATELARARRDLEELAPRHALARSLMIRIDERLDPEEALRGFRALAREELSRASWIATRLLLARCAMRLAATTEDEARRSDLVEAAAAASSEALAAEPAALPWATCALGHLGLPWRLRAAWLDGTLQRLGGDIVLRHDQTTRLCALIAARHLAAGEPEAVIDLGRRVAPRTTTCELAPDMLTMWLAFLERYLEALLFSLPEGNPARIGTALAVIERERECGHDAASLAAFAAIAAMRRALKSAPGDGTAVARAHARLTGAAHRLESLPRPTRNQQRIRVMCDQILEAVEP